MRSHGTRPRGAARRSLTLRVEQGTAGTCGSHRACCAELVSRACRVYAMQLLDSESQAGGRRVGLSPLSLVAFAVRLGVGRRISLRTRWGRGAGVRGNAVGSTNPGCGKRRAEANCVLAHQRRSAQPQLVWDLILVSDRVSEPGVCPLTPSPSPPRQALCFLKSAVLTNGLEPIDDWSGEKACLRGEGGKIQTRLARGVAWALAAIRFTARDKPVGVWCARRPLWPCAMGARDGG